MPNVITVTSVDGAGVTVTAQRIDNVSSMNFNVARSMLFVTHDGGIISEFSLAPVTTVTYTISAGIATVAVS